MRSRAIGVCFACGFTLPLASLVDSFSPNVFSALAGGLFAGYDVIGMNIDLNVNKHWSVFFKKANLTVVFIAFKFFSFHIVVLPTLPADFQKPHLKQKHLLNLFRLLDFYILFPVILK